MHRVNMEEWICREEGICCLTRDSLEQLQLKKLNNMLKVLSQKSACHSIPSNLDTLSQLKTLPFTTSLEVQTQPGHFLACSQAQVSRVISQVTSGTTGGPKRVFYSRNDLRHTVDFFASGISEMLYEGEKCLIGFSFSGPDGLGDLISKAIIQLGAKPLFADFSAGFGSVLNLIDKEKPQAYIGFPVPLLSLLRLNDGKLPIERALLSGDTCTAGVLNSLPMQCFPHYGSRETVLGCAVTCQAHRGMHLRENHIIAEIVDPQGNSLPDGTWGELVITTIGMEAMPLLRYRTGDITRILPDFCPCGGVTRRIDRVRRMENTVVSIEKLDNVLFTIPGIVDYSVSLGNSLDLTIFTLPFWQESMIRQHIRKLYPEIPLNLHIYPSGLQDHPAYPGKRFIRTLEE